MPEDLQNSRAKKKLMLKKDWKKLVYQKWIVKNIPFFLFLGVLTVLYIANGHYADKTIRKINTLEKRVKEMEYDYKTIMRDLIFMSKESELIKAAEPIGLKQLTAPPMKISEHINK